MCGRLSEPRQALVCGLMGMKRRARVLLITSTVIVALLALVGGFGIWSAVNQREKTAAAFAVLDTADRRIDLRHVFPNAHRSKSGVEVRPLGEGPGPVISYSFAASSIPDWKMRLDDAMKRAGHSGEAPWIFQIHGWSVIVLAADADVESGGRVYVTISTH
jgi:hypothetical protein